MECLLSTVEQIMPMMARQVLDPWLAGVLVSAMMAAIMSSADSYLLSAAGSMTRDVYHRILRQTASETELLRISRVVTVLLGAGALLLAVSTDPWNPESTVYPSGPVCLERPLGMLHGSRPDGAFLQQNDAIGLSGWNHFWGHDPVCSGIIFRHWALPPTN